MDLLSRMAQHDHEQVIALHDRASGLRGFIAIHDTTLGPALGGVRLWRYKSEDDALADVFRLSRAMTYKASLAELPAGGGKAVILNHDGLNRTAAFEAFGRVVESLRGRFFTGVDVGTTGEDLAVVGRFTRYVACESSPALGDINSMTATGVWHGLRACLEAAGIAAKGATVAVQGVGSVGLHLARILKREGMKLIIADINAQAVEAAARELGAQVVSPDVVLSTLCDVLAPCALGGVLNRETVPRVAARIVCGCANNVLGAPEDGDALAQRGILYAPDYLVNAGGLIRGAEFYLLNRADSAPSLARIYDRMKRVAGLARERNVSTARIADEIAESRLKRPKTFADLHWGAPAPAVPKCAS